MSIDFMYLDLDVCGRCRRTGANIESALTAVRGVLESAGADVTLTKTLMDSEEKARAAGFVSSPTIRVNGRDVALELRESPCESEACACTEGAGEPIARRVWVYEGNEYLEASVPMIVDAILSAAYGPSAGRPAGAPAEVPENLARFFQSKRRPEANACCEPSEQESCCEPSRKASCCGQTEDANAGGCGCR